MTKHHFSKAKIIFNITLSYILTFLLTIPTSAVTVSNAPGYTIPEETLSFYSANGIYYYDPYGGCVSGSGASLSGTLSGSNNEERLWNYFISIGLSPEATAGILGNLQQESGFNPFATNGKYYGIFQSNSADMISAVENAVGGNYWGKNDAPEDAIIKALEVEIEYLVTDKFVSSEKRFAAYRDAVASTGLSPEDCAELFLVAVERATGGGDQLTSAVAKNFANRLGLGRYTWQHASKRRNNAVSIYSRHGNSVSSSNSSGTTSIVACNYSNSTPYSGTDIPQYFQCGESWSNLMYGPGGINGSEGTSICQSGCGPASFAMMATVLTGRVITPDEVADIAGKAGMHARSSSGDYVGSSHLITRYLAGQYGLQYEELDTCDEATITSYLNDGWMIHTSGQGAAPFTSGGHYIGITGVVDGEWYVANSAGRRNANRSYPPSTVISGMRCGNVKAIK